MLNQRLKSPTVTLIYSAFIAGLCSIIYELLIATTTSYFLGDSVKYFSLTIGIYMAAMGIGSHVSKYIEYDLLEKFVITELILGLVGGISIPVLYFSYAVLDGFLAFYVIFTVVIGFLIGLEIPFLTRLLENYKQLKYNIASVLSFDYFGALIATVAFPFVLLPFFGVYKSSLLFGLVNMSIGYLMIRTFAHELGSKVRFYRSLTLLLTGILLSMLFFANKALEYWDDALYKDRIVHSSQSQYQKIVLTKNKDDIRLFLDGNLQFSSIDEHRYHEALIHVPIVHYNTEIKRVLVMGAGDGIAVRELLKYPQIEEIVLVDLDDQVVQLARSNPHINRINENSLASEKLSIEIADAYTYLRHNQAKFDLVVADLPDPNNNALARLYSKQFFTLLRTNINDTGVFVTQATSPYFAKEAFWSIVATIEAAGFQNSVPYHVNVPSFGDWGFVMASPASVQDVPTIDVTTRYLNETVYPSLFQFGKDMLSTNSMVNHMDQPQLLGLYLRGWQYYH